MNKANSVPCLVFPMGMEAYPFLKRVEVRRRWQVGRAIYREAYFEGSELLIVKSGIGPVKAAAAIQNLTATPAAIISAGTAGALVDDLKVGDLIVSSHTISGDGVGESLASAISLTEPVAAACRSQGSAYRIATIATVKRPVFLREERAILQRATNAHAVDMESHVLAVEADKLGAPFVALRAISDDMDCPPLPDFTRPKDLLRDFDQLPARLTALFRWRKFLRNLRLAVDALHPVLVSTMRSLRNQREKNHRVERTAGKTDTEDM
jgi:nucleoside phosphorylase